MKRILIFLFLISLNFLPARNIFSQNYPQGNYTIIQQNPPEYFHNYIFSNSAGLNFEKSKPTLYLNILRRLNDKFFIGIRGGIYNSKENIDSLMYKLFVKEHMIINPGFYETRAGNVPVEGNMWVLGIQSLYKIRENISGTVTLGVKTIPVRSFKQVVAQIENSGQAISFDYSLGDTYENKNIAKIYYSAGLDYNFDSFQFGIFVDNIFSAGINAGITF